MTTVINGVSADLRIVRGKLRACEITPTDPLVVALQNVTRIENELEPVIDELYLGPNAAKTAADISTFRDLAKKYMDAASVQVLRDLRP